MNNRVLDRCGPHYILVMMIVTRLVACVTGSLCVYYVNLTFTLDSDTQRHFAIAAAGVILAAVFVTLGMALWETTHLRHVLRQLRQQGPVDALSADRAGRQAVLFPGRHALHEAIVDPLITIVPLVIILRIL